MKKVFVLGFASVAVVLSAAAQECTATQFSSENADIFLSAERLLIVENDHDAALVELGRLLASDLNCFERAYTRDLFQAIDKTVQGKTVPSAQADTGTATSVSAAPVAEAEVEGASDAPVSAPITQAAAASTAVVQAGSVGVQSVPTVNTNDAASTASPSAAKPTKLTTFLEGDRDVQPKTSPVILYPLQAAAARLEGQCEVAFIISTEGQPRNMAATCTDDIFKRGAEDAVGRMRFTPKMENGVAVERTNAVFPINFTLDLLPKN